MPPAKPANPIDILLSPKYFIGLEKNGFELGGVNAGELATV
jgi:hypothetical protein